MDTGSLLGRPRGARNGGRDLPFTDWGATFHDNLPPEIAKAIEEAMPREIVADSSWKEKFAERFWDRLHDARLRLRGDGKPLASDPTQTVPRVVLPPSTSSEETNLPRLPRLVKPPERTRERAVSDRAGRRKARRTEMEAAIPSWRPVPASELDLPYTLASWDPEEANPDGSRGAVLLNKEHLAVIALVDEMARDYSVTREDVASWDSVEFAVMETLGQSLVAKVVHAQSVLRRDVERASLRTEYLSDIALTTAGLGMIWEQQALLPKLGGILGRRKAI